MRDKTYVPCSANHGGAINVYGDGDTLTVTNISSSLFANNSVVHGVGGALEVTGGINYVSESTFQSNTAAQYGASVSYQQQCDNVNSDFGK